MIFNFQRVRKTITKEVRLILVLTSLIVAGCSSTQKSDFSSHFASDSNKRGSVETLDDSAKDKGYFQTGNGLAESLEPIQFDKPIYSQSSSDQLELSDEQNIAVAFDSLSLKEFVNHALSNILKVNFVVAPKVSFEGKSVTLEIKEKISQRRFLALFKDLLSQNGLGMKVEEDLVLIHGANTRTGRPALDFAYGRSGSSVPMGSQTIYQLVPVDYIDPKSLHSFLVRLTNAGVEISNDPNLIALQGKRQDILRALSVIRMLDVPQILGRKVLYLQMEYLPSGEFINKVTELLENEGVNVELGLRFTDLNRQNGVVVHANNADLLERVSYWQKQLDTPESTDDKQYFLYYPENMEALKLAEVLGKLVQVREGASANANSSTNNSSVGNTNVNNTQGRNRNVGNSSGAVKSEEFSFVTDENRNVIIIYATASKFKTMLSLLKKLDVTPPQVLIEARLIEITLTDQFSQGIEWSLFGGSAKRDVSVGQNAGFSNGSFSYSISGIDYNAALNFLKNKDKLKVLSSPRIVVSNGESASLNVGTEIPVLTTQSTDVDSDRVLQSVQYRSTGVTLSVEPIVNSSSVISLSISQNVSETSENATSNLNSPIILNRSFDTTVVAHSGQTLVLGGLIRENNSFKDSKIPLLGDIPIIGAAFSNESDSKSRTELLVLITPRIIQNSSDIADIKKLFVDELTLFE